MFPPLKPHTFRVTRNCSRIVAYLFTPAELYSPKSRSGRVSHSEEKEAPRIVPLKEADAFTES